MTSVTRSEEIRYNDEEITQKAPEPYARHKGAKRKNYCLMFSDVFYRSLVIGLEAALKE